VKKIENENRGEKSVILKRASQSTKSSNKFHWVWVVRKYTNSSKVNN
jgi:hypothetical protein